MMAGAELSAEANWKSYQQLIWTQQQIHLQIQQQQQHQQQQQQQQQQQLLQNSKGVVNNTGGMSDSGDLLMSGQPPRSNESDSSNNSGSNNNNNDEKPKDINDPWDNFDAHSAFLGPTLWDKRVPYDGNDFKLEYMELEDFLSENGIPLDPVAEAAFGVSSSSSGKVVQPQDIIPPPTASSLAGSSSSEGPFGSQFMSAGPSRASTGRISSASSSASASQLPRSVSSTHSQPSRSPSPSGSSTMGLNDGDGFDPDSTSCSGFSKVNLHVDVPFSVADMALASVPGHEFDPRTRAFTDEELKPQPMIKKSKKQFVPDEQKDAKYWSRRRKNNLAAKRSRDARRIKENQIAMRAGFLEKENNAMKEEIERVTKENMILRERLARCRREHNIP